MVADILAPYFRRIERGVRLAPHMRQRLEARPLLVDLIRRTAEMLVEMETQGGRPVRMTRKEMYWRLLGRHPEFIDDRSKTGLVFPDQLSWAPVGQVPSIQLDRLPTVTINLFTEAITIAKRVGLIVGWGSCCLDPDISRALRRTGTQATQMG